MRSWVCATANTRWKACSFTRSRYSRSTATPCSRIFWRRVADGQETSMDMPAAIRAVTERRDLRSEEMTEVMRTIMTGGATSAQIGGFLIGLRMKGETVDEIAAAARVMRELASRVEVSGAHVVDTCGTGGGGRASGEARQSLGVEPFGQRRRAGGGGRESQSHGRAGRALRARGRCRLHVRAAAPWRDEARHRPAP